MSLSPQQIEAYDAIMKWRKTNEKHFVLAGYAGTGKTTLAKYIAAAMGEENVIFCSYTGKAANVLREKGCRKTGTIHSFLYKLIDDMDGKPRFKLNRMSDLASIPLVVIDEYSMLNHEIISDIHTLAKKVLYLGDPFQLPPVSGQSVLEPNHFITEIHRQALDSPIIRAATKIRNMEQLAYCDDGEFVFQPKVKLGVENWMQADQTIVGYNNTRREWNKKFRRLRGFGDAPDDLAVHGEKIICLKNSREHGLFNGMIGTCGTPEIDGKGYYSVDFKSEDMTYEGLPVWRGDMEGRVPDKSLPRHLQRFDHAGAITAHKSQGSEWDNVLVYNEPVGKEHIDKAKWTYTALTRGRKKVVLVDRA
jgi:exodeoxyribonuclease-5